MKRIGKLLHPYLSFWHGLLALTCVLLAFLFVMQVSALGTSSSFLCFNDGHACLSWKPSQGTVDHYLLEITDTRLVKGASLTSNRLTTTRYATSVLPCYQLSCAHGHAYQVRVKAVSPAGASSEYSERSVLFICDRQAPALVLDPLTASQKVRTRHLTVTGSFDEPHLAALTVNGVAADIDYQRQRFSASITLSPGDNHLQMLAADLAGNTSTEQAHIMYAPISIISLPEHGKIYWNGNYAYPGRYGGTAPRAYNQAGQQKQTLRISLPGFHDYYGIIDFSDLSRDAYIIPLVPYQPAGFTRLSQLFPPEEISVPFARSRPFVVDYNLDGIKDVLVGTADGTVALFLNRGSNAAPIISEHQLLNADDQPIDVGADAAPFMVDYDNNGTADLLIGNGEGLLYYCKNVAHNTAPAFTSPVLLTDGEGIPITVESGCMPWVVDWNGDGRKDLLLGNGSGCLMISLNEGSDRQPVFSSLRPLTSGGKEIQVDGPSAPCAVDWNADGQPDVLLGTGNGQILVYYTASGAEEPVITSTESIELNGQAMMMGSAVAPFPVDWDGDGRPELLIGTGEGEIYHAL